MLGMHAFQASLELLLEVGIDVVSDGEMSKISYATYIRHRLTGFEIGEMPRAVNSGRGICFTPARPRRAPTPTTASPA